MRFIPTQIHGVLDYAAGAMLIVAPWLLGFAAGGPETWTPVVLGGLIILYSLMTNYELGLVKAIAMPAHLWLDALAGVWLLTSPIVFTFSEIVWVPHVVIGVLEIGAALTTRTRTSRERTPATHHPAPAGPEGAADHRRSHVEAAGRDPAPDRAAPRAAHPARDAR